MVVRYRGSHISLTIGLQMAVRSTSGSSRPLPPGRFLILLSVRSLVDPKAIAGLEGLGKLKIQWPNRESNTRPLGFWHSASTNYASACSE
jgi:hypothetical protein